MEKSDYKIKEFESGMEEELVKVGTEVASKWVWPYQHSLEGFKNIISKPDFEPELLLTCLKDGKIVGYVLARIGEDSLIRPDLKEECVYARILYPRVLPGHEKATDLLMEKIIEALKKKGVELVRTRVSSMREGSLQFIEKWGFKQNKIYPVGYKLYYNYELSKGKIERTTKDVLEFDKERDLKECINWVADFFVVSKEQAEKYILDISSREDLVSHLVIREDDKLAGYCYACPNSVNAKIIASFYIDAINEDYFDQLIIQTINASIERNANYFLIDLVYGVLKYEDTVKSLGLSKVTTWGVFEKSL
ncbi:MAG: GNAT family N-acetyltransferase [Candidatus Heimdallarchaeota archaeon]